MRAIILLILAVGSFAAESQQEQVDKVFAKWDTTVSPGCALSVMKDGHIVYKRGYGMADLDHDIPITPETVFHVASISKQFTAAAIILLAQDGKLSLDDDVRKYITELPDFGERITIRHLIYHTSGLRDQWSLLGLAGWRYSLDLITDDDVLDLMSRQKELNFKPGEKHVYCNTGYTLLAQIVKRVSGQSFREFTTNRIFKPLGMHSTHFRDDHGEIVKHIAYGYVDGDGGVYRLSVTNFDTVGATSLLTTVADLAQWDENFYHPRVGGAAMVAQQLQRGKLNSGKEIYYAFGLSIGKYRGLPTVDHDGADAGYRADLVRFPEQHFSVACLCNKGETAPGLLTRKVADIYLADQFKEPPPAIGPAPAGKPVTVSAERLVQYAGLYWKKDEERPIRIVFQDGKLYWAYSEERRGELSALSESRFRPADSAQTITFEDGLLSLRTREEKPDSFARVVEFHPTAGQLAAYAGVYTSEEIEPVYRIVVEKDRLVLKRPKQKPVKLLPLIEDYFESPQVDVHFQRDATGKITGCLLNTGRIQNFRMKKTAL